jgi:hypothetical protein
LVSVKVSVALVNGLVAMVTQGHGVHRIGRRLYAAGFNGAPVRKPVKATCGLQRTGG